MTDDSQRIREAIKQLEVRGARVASQAADDGVGSDLAITLDAARRLVDGELLPGFPTDEDVEVAARAMGSRNPSVPGWANLPVYWRNSLLADARAALVAVAESRLSAPSDPDLDLDKRS